MENKTPIESKLNAKEEQVMRILWDLGRGFVNDIIDRLPEPKPPYNTISSITRKLSSEGWLGVDEFGKSHRYYPLVGKEEYRRATFKDYLSHYFDGKPENVLSYFVREENLDTNKLAELLNKIKDMDKT